MLRHFAPLLLIGALSATAVGATCQDSPKAEANILETSSHRPGFKLRLLHKAASPSARHVPVLFIHGASFPAELSFDFRMGGQSWMDVMAASGYATYALDFLGYGKSDRYPEMAEESPAPLGRATDVQADIDRAVELIRACTGQPRVSLIAHSWGGTAAALYTQNHPAKVASLVLFAAITPRFPRPAALPHQLNHGTNAMTPAQRVHQMDDLRPSGQPHVLAAEVFDHWGDQWLASDPLSAKLGSTEVRFPAGPDQDIADLAAGRPYYIPSQIVVPTLLIRGEWDRNPSDEDFTWLAGQLTAAPYKKYVVIAEGTHVMHLERSRHELYSEVLSFLEVASGQTPGKP
jgi:pimeloyl-ACP methyl ester carboxylesterase